jgi:hypothetical protein
LREECEQGRTLGMDGKTLIHPSQVGSCNEIFSRPRRRSPGSRRSSPPSGSPRTRKRGNRRRGPHGRAAPSRYGRAHRPDRRADSRDGDRLQLIVDPSQLLVRPQRPDLAVLFRFGIQRWQHDFSLG